ncbi:hypothetical protein QBC36DRAFT_389052 [Triangularia setosa]|uniref:Uncharacterized protein n=1 Tax=Triangularia setosa TaxID=2587417 RepID=A0AAN6W3A1_9PEZI|nr:hypothetical protein QBC36DRAFT_389052 [Podospora setosa]
MKPQLPSPPLPPGSMFNPNMHSGDIDHNLHSPLSPGGYAYPCGPNFDIYALSPQGNPVATWSAGSTQSFTIDSGSCQASLSIDQGKTFKVLRSYEGGCPLSSSYQFNISGGVPAAKRWLGNREMYMNCAVVDITSGSGGKSGRAAKPEIFKEDIGNGCRTIDMFDVRFPHPGDDVVKGEEGMFAAPVGSCGTTKQRFRG